MKVFLDEGVPELLRHRLGEHEVLTVSSLGAKGTKNGKLLRLVEDVGARAFVTADKSIPRQQELTGRPFATLLLSTNSWPLIRERVQVIRDALYEAEPGEVTPVDCGSFVPRRFRNLQP